VQFPKKSIPTQWKINEILRGGGKSQKPNYVMESMKLNMKFWGWGRVKPKGGEGMYVFLNNTIIDSVFVLYFTGKSSKGCWWKKPRYWSVALLKATPFDWQ